MGALTIGRVGLDLDLEASDLRFANRRDPTLRISGEVAPVGGSAEATTIRDELVRMATAGDLVLPVSLSSDPTINGYYQLVDVSLQVGVASLSGYYPFRASLIRHGSEGGVGLESRLTIGLRANDHSITFATTEPFWGIFDGSELVVDLDSTTYTTFLRDSAEGDIRIYRDLPTSLLSLVSWQDVADYYIGSAKVETGATLRVLSGFDAEDDPGNWRLDNGLVRVTPNATNSRLDVQHFDGTIWETVKTYDLIVGAAEIDRWERFTVLRNDPAAVSIRLWVGQQVPVFLDLTLRRGSRFVEGRLSRDTTATWEVDRRITEAGTSLTGALRATANDGDGNRYVIGSSVAMTKDTTNGGILNSSTATAFPFFIGSAIAGSGAVAGDAPADLVNQYHGYLTEVVQPVMS